MPVYDFSFDSRYAGQAATIRDAAGVEQAGSPVTLDSDGAGTITLPLGTYEAHASIPVNKLVTNATGDPVGERVVGLTYDVPSSIGAAGGGGGLSSEVVHRWAETGDPQTPAYLSTWAVPWNGTQEGITYDGDGSIVLDSPGLYSVYFYVQFAEPAQATAVRASAVAGTGAGGQIDATAWFQPSLGDQFVYGAGVLRLDADQTVRFYVSLNMGTASSPVTPAILDAYIQFVKLIDA